MTLARHVTAEALGTALLLAVVVGSATMADRLAGGNAALALFANSFASSTGLAALILAFGAVSRAHFNPAVTLSEVWQGGMKWREALLYVAAQFAGALAGVAAAHAMFGEPILSSAAQARTGPSLWWSELLATFGLIMVISGCARSRPTLTPFAVAAYVASAYWFTASSSFANPALTLARAATNTAAGIRLQDVTGYVAAQLLGAIAATLVFTWLHSPAKSREAAQAGESAFKPVLPP